MLFDFKQTILFMVIVFDVVYTEFKAINWNISTDHGASHMEREYKYPMFTEVARAPCDVTEDLCDPFCCHDVDCDGWQRQSFHCMESTEICNGILSYFDCNCNNSDKPEWFSFLCYVYYNPIYLGMYFAAPPKIESISIFKNLVSRNKNNNNLDNNMYRYGHKGDKIVKNNVLSHYKYGSAIMTYISGNDSYNFPSISSLLGKLSLNYSPYTCVSHPVKYGINSTAVCLTKITRELCENGYTLGIAPYLVQDNSNISYKNASLVLKNLNFLEGVEVEFAIKWASTKYQIKNFRKKVNVFQYSDLESCESCSNFYNTVWTENVCQNVLMYVQHEFIVNGSDIIKLKVEYALSNISIPDELVSEKRNDDVKPKYNYFKQIFKVKFIDIFSIIEEGQNSTLQEASVNRGYFIGEQLNFGYRRLSNSSVSWEKGVLGVFKNENWVIEIWSLIFDENPIGVIMLREQGQYMLTS